MLSIHKYEAFTPRLHIVNFPPFSHVPEFNKVRFVLVHIDVKVVSSSSGQAFVLIAIFWSTERSKQIGLFNIRRSWGFFSFFPNERLTKLSLITYCDRWGMPAGSTYPSGHLVPSPVVGLACAPIVETRFLELAMSLLDFSPRIPLGTFSILLICFFMIRRRFVKILLK